jgi:tRNA dimethylallyltransferase
MSAKGTLVVIGGPTASGKTRAAALLARHYGTEVISADSRQFYEAMRIGTARPSEEELFGVPHHFLGHLDIHEAWSAGDFARAAEPVLRTLMGHHGIAILVGGSGLYIDALVKGLDPMPAMDDTVRERLQHRFQLEGLPPLLAELERLDPATFDRIDRNNPHRVIRALEVCVSTGRPFSSHHSTPADRTDLQIVRLAMDVPRPQLYTAIDARVDRMIAEGLVEEVRSLLPHRAHNALRTVGYRELFAYFDGDCSLAQAIDQVKQHTRNYAKRQMTWLRREATWHWCVPTDLTMMQHHIDTARS